MLISPPVFDFYFTPARKEPLGLLYLKASIEQCHNVTVDIYDTLVSGKVKKITPPKSFDYLKSIYNEDYSPFSLFSNYYRFGDSTAKILQKVKADNYDLVGISALFSGYFPDVEHLIKVIKKNTDSVVIVGGWAVSTEGKSLMKESEADFFLNGCGEHSFPKFVEAFIGNRNYDQIPGLLYRTNNIIHQNRAAAPVKIPLYFPNRNDGYFCWKKKIARVILSKGCLNKCNFCVVHQNREFSIRSLQSIEKELAYLLESGIEIVNFEDDNLFYNKEFSVKLLKILKKYHTMGLSYTAMNGITAANVQSFIPDIIEAGFIELNFSLVTSNNKLITTYKRPFTLEIINELVAQIQGKIKTIIFIILGLPGDFPENVVLDILALANMHVIIGVSPLYLIPGIKVFEQMGIPSDRRLLRGSALYKFGSSFTREDVASLWKFVRMINFLKTEKHFNSDLIKENILYFRRSLREKRWYRLTKSKTWEKGFSFSVPLPEDFTFRTLDGVLHKFSYI